VLATTPLTMIGGAGDDTLIGNGEFVGGEAQSSINTKFVVTATGGDVTYRQTTQGGVSTRGFGVNNPNDVGVQGTRGIDGDGANGNPNETLIVKFADGNLAAASASLTLGVYRNSDNGNDYIVEAFYGNESVSAVTGGFGVNGANNLQTVNLNFGGQLFDKVTIRNAQFTNGFGATTFSFVINDINGTSGIPDLNQDTINGFRQGTDKIRINTSIHGQGELDLQSGTGPTASGLASKIETVTTTAPSTR
jgi:hypothetical protein